MPSERPTTTERERTKSLLDGLHVIPFDGNVGMLAGELSASLISQGERIEVEDVIIGATAVFEDEPVVTRNAKHFERLDDVGVVTY